MSPYLERRTFFGGTNLRNNQTAKRATNQSRWKAYRAKPAQTRTSTSRWRPTSPIDVSTTPLLGALDTSHQVPIKCQECRSEADAQWKNADTERRLISPDICLFSIPLQIFATDPATKSEPISYCQLGVCVRACLAILITNGHQLMFICLFTGEIIPFVLPVIFTFSSNLVFASYPPAIFARFTLHFYLFEVNVPDPESIEPVTPDPWRAGGFSSSLEILHKGLVRNVL